VRRFHRALLHAIDHAESRHQLAGGMHRDFEPAVGQLLDLLREDFGGTVDGVQRLGKAGGQAPAHCGLRVHGGRGGSREDAGDAGMLESGTTIHENTRELRTGWIIGCLRACKLARGWQRMLGHLPSQVVMLLQARKPHGVRPGLHEPRSGPWIARNSMQRGPAMKKAGFTPAFFI
jgi:hypothetical protein